MKCKMRNAHFMLTQIVQVFPEVRFVAQFILVENIVQTDFVPGCDTRYYMEYVHSRHSTDKFSKGS